MNAGESLRSGLRSCRLALDALRKNPLRAALTTLGIVIGIAAVIVMTEIGEGSSAAIRKTVAGMGANMIMVLPGAAASGGVSYGSGSAQTLSVEDADAISRSAPSAAAVAPVVRGRAQAVVGTRNWVPMSVIGSTPSYLTVRDWAPPAEGRMFSDREVRGSAKVCLVGRTIVRELFGGGSPVGKELRLQNVPLKVTGVLRPKGANMMGSDQDDIVLLPWTTLKYRVSGDSGGTGAAPAAAAATPAQQGGQTLYPGPASSALYPLRAAGAARVARVSSIEQIMVSAASPGSVQRAMVEITSVLRTRRRAAAGEPDDFSLRDMAEMTKVLTTTSSVMTRLLLSVALISLVVGGVGIMNIMLVSVTERTKEIGLRMAVGAAPADVLRQFLVEAVVLCLAGGLAGILLGRGLSFGIGYFFGWPIKASPGAVAAAFGVSAGVGIVFGFYPAWRASRLDPIEALRHE